MTVSRCLAGTRRNNAYPAAWMMTTPGMIHSDSTGMGLLYRL